MITFTPGQTYYTRSICDHNCIVKLTVAKRTAKTITTTEGKTFRVSGAVESVKPWGNHSMCPIITADDTKELKPDWEK